MSQSLTVRYEWKDIAWKKAQVKVFKLQRRIYRASLSGDVRKVHKLQRLLMKSWYAKCLAVRRVTQENQGKKTAGVDGVKTLNPKQRLQLVKQLELKASGLPTRRVWIPKPGKDEKRPLGIPVMRDRATQALLKMALEPEWESKFEPNSYGFRPGRSAHDAIEAIFTASCQKAKYVLDADIAKCFDRINHQKLLEKLNTFPTIGRVIRTWLKAGVLDKGELFPTKEGTPQRGVISPLLANIALHGLETHIRQHFPQGRWVNNRTQYLKWKPQVIRYADDFVILHHDLDTLQECKILAEEWLKEIGLELKPSKTRISHTLDKVEEQKPGFDFLGFNIRAYRSSKYKCAVNNGELTGFNLIIKPAKQNVKAQYRKIAQHIQESKGAPQEKLIRDLNPAIIGWSNYYSTKVSKRTFAYLDYKIFWKLLRWGKFRHPKKGTRWIVNKYWLVNQGQGWKFGKGTIKLAYHANIPINKYVKVKGTASPYDGNWVYWSKRRAKYPGVSTILSRTLHRQKGKCGECGLNFYTEDRIELHHLDGNYRNHRQENLIATHCHCHDRIHSGKGNLSCLISTHDKGQLGEKPDERKLSRPVLKPSMGGDLHA